MLVTPTSMWGMPTRKEFMKDQWLEGKLSVIEEVSKSIDHVEGKYRCIMDIAKSLKMDELQVLEKMIQDLWWDKLEQRENYDATQQSDIQR